MLTFSLLFKFELAQALAMSGEQRKLKNILAASVDAEMDQAPAMKNSIGMSTTVSVYA